MTHSNRDAKGIHILGRGNKALDIDTVKLLKTQDAGYLRVQSAIERKAVERLQVEAALLNLDSITTKGNKRKHTVFVESRKEAKSFDPVKHFDTVPELVCRAENRLRAEQLAELELRKLVPESEAIGRIERLEKLKARKKRAKAREGKLKELAQRLRRREELQKAEVELALQRERFGKGVGLGKPGKFSKERKK